MGCQGQDTRQGRNSTGPTTSHLRGEATGRWTHVERLQHPEGIHPSLGAPSAGRWQEAQEEELHHTQEDQTQEEEGQARHAQILQSRRERKNHQTPSRVSLRVVRSRSVHGTALRSTVLWEVLSDLCVQ